MTLLAGYPWRLKYTPEDGNLVKLFYVPALEDAVRYDRLTGYFNSGALTLAARGIEGLVRSNGHMRLVVGCTLSPPEIEAIEKGEKLRDMVEQHVAAVPLTPPNQTEHSALELLAWMIARGLLDVRVAVPCDERRRPIPADGIFHEKAGIIEDKCGDKIAWNGSLNETGAGWNDNWESINVYTGWDDGKRVQKEEENFTRIWADRCGFIITLDVPSALKQDLMRFLPDDDRPARLKEKEKPKVTTTLSGKEPPPEPPVPLLELRRDVWRFIKLAPTLPNGGERVGEATCSVKVRDRTARVE